MFLYLNWIKEPFADGRGDWDQILRSEIKPKTATKTVIWPLDLIRPKFWPRNQKSHVTETETGFETELSFFYVPLNTNRVILKKPYPVSLLSSTKEDLYLVSSWVRKFQPDME